jgi:8-oxo-dGTP pyrophosphatase MutT (NUDIX family)
MRRMILAEQIIPRPESTGKRYQARSGMSEQHLSSKMDGVVRDAATEDVAQAAILQTDTAGEKKKRKRDRPLEERRIHEAGGVIICDGKVVLRLTDKQRWIFPKGKVKKRESARDAASREATEETGLKVEVIDQVADLLIRHEGKKRRFVFFLMRATAKTWDWPHHEGRDTFLIAPERVGGLLHHKGYASVWEACEARVRMMLDDPPPFVAHPSGQARA